MAFEQAAAEQEVGRLLSGGAAITIVCSRGVAGTHGAGPVLDMHTVAIETMLDAFERARCALENLADLVVFSAQKPSAGWSREPAVGEARDRVLRAQREALDLADQVLDHRTAGGAA